MKDLQRDGRASESDLEVWILDAKDHELAGLKGSAGCSGVLARNSDVHPVALPCIGCYYLKGLNGKIAEREAEA